jgi:hypothetical protein
MSCVPPGKVMATFTSLPAAFFLAKASLSGAAFVVTPMPLYSLATEIAWQSRLRRHRMYIGVGLFSAVVVPMVIWYGLGVRMCAPSMPPAPEPSTMLSRVVPHEACLATLASVMPYLSNSFFSLAMISGEASVSAMKPKVTLLVSGPLACANAPDGKALRTAPIRAALAVAPLRTERRLNRVIFVMAVLLNVSVR